MEELVKKAVENDENAFDELIRTIQKELYLVAKTRLKDEDDIADALQETILKCFQNIHKLRDFSLFKTWTIKILINECNKIYKRKSKYKISIEDKEIEKYIKIEEKYAENMDFDLLIRNLEEDEKLILTLYYYLRYTTKEISKIIKKNEGTVRSKISRAKAKLKKQYKGGNYGRN